METPQLQYFSWWSMPLLCCLCSPFLVATVSTWSEYLYRFFWEMASRHFRIQLRLVRQCLHVHVSLQRRFGNFTHFCVKVDSAPEVHGGFWVNFLFLRERVLGYGGSWTNLTLFLVKVDSDPEVVSPGAVRTWKFEHYFSGFCFRCRNAALFGLRSSGR